MAVNVDIFEILKNIDLQDKDYFKSLSNDERKSVYFYLIQRWLTGTTNKKQILYVNSFCNNKVWKLYNEPDLLYYLMCASSIDGKKYYKWPAKKKKETRTETVKMIMNYYKCAQKDAIDYIKILTIEDIEEMSLLSGLDKETINKIKKEIK